MGVQNGPMENRYSSLAGRSWRLANLHVVAVRGSTRDGEGRQPLTAASLAAASVALCACEPKLDKLLV